MKKLTQYIEEHYVTGTDKESVSKLVDKYGDDMFCLLLLLIYFFLFN